MPAANTLVQYYLMLKDLGDRDEFEVISVDINDAMNVTYSRYYLDFPWLMIDISNLLLRTSLVHDYYTSTTVPQLVILNRFGEVVDRSAHEKLENFLADKQVNLSEIYPDNEVNDYNVYASYNNDEAIPALPAPLSPSRTHSEDRRQDSYEDNKSILNTQKQTQAQTKTQTQSQGRAVSMDVEKYKNPLAVERAAFISVDHTTAPPPVTGVDRDSVKKPNVLSKIVHSFYGDDNNNAPPNQIPPQQQKQQQVGRSNTSNPQPRNNTEREVRVFPSVSGDTITSVDASKIKQLLTLLPSLPAYARHKIYVESAILFSVLNARKEVDIVDVILTEIQEQQKQYPRHLLTRRANGPGITEIKERVRSNERLISLLTYNERFPAYSLGFPNVKWEKDISTELHILHCNWESRIQSLYHGEGDETFHIFSQIQQQYQEEYWRYSNELLQWCKIERINRESTAKKYEFFVIFVSLVIGLCIPVIVGVIIGVYAH